MAFKKRDWLFVALIVVIIGIFIAISGEEKTSKVPYDDIHGKFYDIVKVEGKKATEKFCKECHNPDNIALPAGHPPPFRCLFCHKFEQR
jgi:hypothetical protein